MSVLNRIAAFWRNLFRKGDVEQELSDELAYALDALVEKKITEGLSEVEARRQAAIELGGVEQLKEKVREAKAGYYIEGVGRDLRYAVRMFFKNPGFAAVAIIALALGIGANTAIFSLVNGVLLRPLPFPDAERIIYIEGKNPAAGITESNISFLDFTDWSQQTDLFASTAAYWTGERPPWSGWGGAGTRAARRCDDRVLLRARGPACSRANVRSRRRQRVAANRRDHQPRLMEAPLRI